VAKIWSASIAEAVAKAVLSHQTLNRERTLRADRVTSEKDLQQSARLDVDQQFPPALCAFPHTHLEADQFLLALGRRADQYQHALGHQVGRTAHDGGTVLGPRWERYGRLPYQSVQEGEVYTLELGVSVDGRGYLGIEEMVQVTAEGCDWLTRRQRGMRILTR